VPTVDDVVGVISDETGIEATMIKPTTRLLDLGLTSYALMRLLVRIEDHFECEIDAADFVRVFTMAIDDLREKIEQSISAAS
jgi:acyl carrier protein